MPGWECLSDRINSRDQFGFQSIAEMDHFCLKWKDMAWAAYVNVLSWELIRMKKSPEMTIIGSDQNGVKSDQSPEVIKNGSDQNGVKSDQSPEVIKNGSDQNGVKSDQSPEVTKKGKTDQNGKSGKSNANGQRKSAEKSVNKVMKKGGK
ncbi:hypothetical protein niasHT_009103 [Heterodera trifolii]|uniref:Uncharacterized protein n=1 Tax=Heterodera trifolii TaxID=157864 RepID=A0ABD2M5K9_9BILA